VGYFLNGEMFEKIRDYMDAHDREESAEFLRCLFCEIADLSGDRNDKADEEWLACLAIIESEIEQLSGLLVFIETHGGKAEHWKAELAMLGKVRERILARRYQGYLKDKAERERIKQGKASPNSRERE
jgi:hypothetical protein